MPACTWGRSRRPGCNRNKPRRQRLSLRNGRSLRASRLEKTIMGKGILLWLIGVPIPVILLLWLFFR